MNDEISQLYLYILSKVRLEKLKYPSCICIFFLKYGLKSLGVDTSLYKLPLAKYSYARPHSYLTQSLRNKLLACPLLSLFQYMYYLSSFSNCLKRASAGHGISPFFIPIYVLPFFFLQCYQKSKAARPWTLIVIH